MTNALIMVSSEAGGRVRTEGRAEACRSIGQTLSKVFALHHMAIELAIDAIGQRAGALILRSALISGSRQCGLASRFTSLACSRSLTTGRAALSNQCALLCWCQFSFRFRFHDFPSF